MPERKEYILYCKLSPLQERLYKEFLSIRNNKRSKSDWLNDFHILNCLVAHPLCMRDKLFRDEKKAILDAKQNDESNDEAEDDEVCMPALYFCYSHILEIDF